MANIAQQEIFINYISELKRIFVGRNNQPITQLFKVYYNCQTDYYFQIVNKNNQIVSLAGREFKIYGTYTDAKKQTHILFFTNSYNIEDNTLHFHINTNTEDYKSYVNDPEGKVAYVTIIETTPNGVSVVLNDKGLFYPRTGLENDTPIDVVYETILTGVTVPLTGSFAAGENISLLPGADSFAFGTGLITQSENQLVVGSYNVPDGQQVFIVGNGTSDNDRSNIFTVNSLGEAYLSGARVLTQYDRINVSQLVNDVGYITINDVAFYTAGSGLALSDENVFSLTAHIPTTVAELEDASDYALVSSIPTKVSQLQNDAGYITNAAITYYAGEGLALDDHTFSLTAHIPLSTSELVNDSNYVTRSEIPEGTVYAAGEGLALDDTTHTFYITAAIPTSTSQLTNDSEFATSAQVSSIVEGYSYQTAPQVSAIASAYAEAASGTQYKAGTGLALSSDNQTFYLTASIPTSTSQLTNDANYITGITFDSFDAWSEPLTSIPATSVCIDYFSNFEISQGESTNQVNLHWKGVKIVDSETNENFVPEIDWSNEFTVTYDDEEAGYVYIQLANPVPLSTSQLTNDSEFATTGWVSGWVEEHSTSPLSGGTNIEISNDVVNCTLSAVSDLTNDVGYLVEGDLSAVSEFANDVGYLTESDLSNKQVLSSSNSDQITYDSSIDIFNTVYTVSNDAITLNTVTVPAGSLGVGEVATFEEWIYTADSFTTVNAGSNVFIGEVPSSFTAATNHVFVRRLVNNGGTITQYVSFAYEVPTT